MMRRRVFLFEPCKHSLDNAPSYGEVILLYDGSEHRPTMWTQQFINDCMNRLKRHEYDPEVDYFMVCGSQTPLTIIICTLALTFETINLLLYDSRHNEYVSKTLLPHEGTWL